MTPSPESLLQSASQALAAGALSQARQLVEQSLARHPNDFEALLLLGHVLERLGATDEAVAIYDRAAKLVPGHALPFTRAAVLRFRARFGPPPQPRPLASGQGAVSMRTLGENGRFGNQLLQYAFLRLYAERHGLSSESADWIGRDLFDLDDPWPVANRPAVDEADRDLLSELATSVPSLKNHDLHGYFCGRTSPWRPHQRRFRQIFTPGRKVQPLLDHALATLAGHGRTIVAVHLRRTDFGYGRFWVAPSSWYRRWLESIWSGLDRPVLYVATDDPRTVTELAGFPAVSAASLGVELPGAEFLLDHHVLAQAHHLAIANSSFSFTAAMLNTRCEAPVRPDPVRRTLVPFDPWDSPVLLDAVDDGSLPTDAREMIARAIPPQGLVIHVGEPCAAWSTVARTVHPNLQVLETPDFDVDGLRRSMGIGQVNALVVERAGDLAAVLAGCARSFDHARIDAVHFRCTRGGPARQLLAPLFESGFAVLRPRVPSTLVPVAPSDTLEAGLHFALNERLLPLFLGRQATDLDVAGLCAEHRIRIRGVLHVGAHEGQEIATYDRLAASQVTFVEANPQVHTRLVQAMRGRSHVRCVHRAVSDRAGTVRLHLASFDQSSSILPMSGHRDIYPDIVPSGSVEVRASTIDELVEELGLPPEACSLLHLDIQGAEAMALRGAARTLTHAEAVLVEVSFADLYEHGAQIEEIDDLLRAAGFRRKAMLSAFHPSWGDAFYVRDRR